MTEDEALAQEIWECVSYSYDRDRMISALKAIIEKRERLAFEAAREGGPYNYGKWDTYDDYKNQKMQEG
jgi:hypothetical protein